METEYNTIQNNWNVSLLNELEDDYDLSLNESSLFPCDFDDNEKRSVEKFCVKMNYDNGVNDFVSMIHDNYSPGYKFDIHNDFYYKYLEYKKRGSWRSNTEMNKTSIKFGRIRDKLIEGSKNFKDLFSVNIALVSFDYELFKRMITHHVKLQLESNSYSKESLEEKRDAILVEQIKTYGPLISWTYEQKDLLEELKKLYEEAIEIESNKLYEEAIEMESKKLCEEAIEMESKKLCEEAIEMELTKLYDEEIEIESKKLYEEAIEIELKRLYEEAIEIESKNKKVYEEPIEIESKNKEFNKETNNFKEEFSATAEVSESPIVLKGVDCIIKIFDNGYSSLKKVNEKFKSNGHFLKKDACSAIHNLLDENECIDCSINEFFYALSLSNLSKKIEIKRKEYFCYFISQFLQKIKNTYDADIRNGYRNEILERLLSYNDIDLVKLTKYSSRFNIKKNYDTEKSEFSIKLKTILKSKGN